MISDQVCDRDFDQRSGWCGAHHVTRYQQGDRDQEVIEVVISDQVCDRDQASVGYTTRSATRKGTAIGQVHQVCAPQVQGCYLLERTTRDMRCLRHWDRDMIVGFN